MRLPDRASERASASDAGNEYDYAGDNAGYKHHGAENTYRVMVSRERQLRVPSKTVDICRHNPPIHTKRYLLEFAQRRAIHILVHPTVTGV